MVGGPVSMTIMGAVEEALPWLLTAGPAPPPPAAAAAVMVDDEALALLGVVSVKTDGGTLLLCRVLPPAELDAAGFCISTSWGG